MFRSIFKIILTGLIDSTVHKHPEDFLKNGPKHVGANFKCFKCFNVNLVLFKEYIVCA
jgi:hypothetical protein